MIEKIWVEKYRPKGFKGLIGNEQLKETLMKYKEKGVIPNLLLYGPPGTGKSTIAKIIIRTFNCEYLFVNGSDETGVDGIRSKVGTFASSVGFSDFKVVFIDESDHLSINAQAALRYLIESSSDNTRFIFACNYPNKLIEPLRSRFQMFEVKPVKLEEDLIQRAIVILDKEGIKYKEEDVKSIVTTAGSDVRRLIQMLEQNSITGELKLGAGGVVKESYLVDLVELLKKKESFQNIRQFLANVSGIDFNLIYRALFDSVEEYCKKGRDGVLLDIAEHMYKDSFVVDKEINLCALIIKILKQL